MRILLALAALVLATAAAPADPLLEKLVAGARAVPPASTAFERIVRTTSQDAGAAAETKTRVDRWDGQRLVLVSIDGRPPTAAETSDFGKAAAARPMSGYYRVADFLKNGAARISDPQGRTVYRISGLPKGSVDIGKDISADLVADATIDTSGPQPYVSHLRIWLPKPVSFFMVAKLDSFEVVNDYRPGPAGRPALIRSLQTIAGAQFGKSGTTRTESNYTVTR